MKRNTPNTGQMMALSEWARIYGRLWKSALRPHNGNVGETRIRMAKLLEKTVPGLVVEPHELWSQIPEYSTAQWDCCSWGGDGSLNRSPVYIASWNTMRDCLRYGIDVTVDVNGRNTYAYIDVSAKGKPNDKARLQNNDVGADG